MAVPGISSGWKKDPFISFLTISPAGINGLLQYENDFVLWGFHLKLAVSSEPVSARAVWLPRWSCLRYCNWWGSSPSLAHSELGELSQAPLSLPAGWPPITMEKRAEWQLQLEKQEPPEEVQHLQKLLGSRKEGVKQEHATSTPKTQQGDFLNL